ncbi:MAG: DUF3048 domain-containing protein [Clostridiaceae bacterium]
MKKTILGFVLLLSISLISICGYLLYKSYESKPVVSEQVVSEETTTPKEIIYGTAPFTGEKLNEDNANNIPFMAVIENSKDARPQSGLVDADIIFETIAEGGIPRFLALFHSNIPEKIGPIRSARTYFVDIAKEFKLPFAHCGGNEDALNQIKKENLMSINEIAYGAYFYRDDSRYAPHNLYTNYDLLSEFITSKNYVKKKMPTYFKYSEDYYNKDNLTTCTNLLIQPNASYNTSYEFDDGKYYKSMDGESSKDLDTNEQIAAKNIVIQYTTMKVKSEELGLNIRLTGSGKGIIISNGKYINVTWSKSNDTSKTTFKDEKGTIIPLSPGNTIWHIIDENTKVNIS